MVLATIGASVLTERVAQAQSPTIVFTGAQDAIHVIQTFSSVISWLNCNEGGYCPESDAQAAADRVISTLSSIYAHYDTDIALGDFQTVLDPMPIG
jgi:hypothetical protein